MVSYLNMKPFYYAILAALVWGIAPILEKTGLKNIEPLSGVLVRSGGVILGAIIMSLCNINVFKSALKADPRAILFLFMGGLLASILGQMFFYNALKHGEVSKMVPIAASAQIRNNISIKIRQNQHIEIIRFCHQLHA